MKSRNNLKESELEIEMKKVFEGKVVEESQIRESIPEYIPEEKEKIYLSKVAMENFEKNPGYNYLKARGIGSGGKVYSMELKGK